MQKLYKIQEEKEPNIFTYLKNGKIDFLISMPREDHNPRSKSAYMIRRAAVDCGVPLITNAKVAKVFVRALRRYPDLEKLQIKAWSEYI